MAVIAAQLMHAVVQGTMCRCQNQAHALVRRILSPRADRVQIGQNAFDLLQDGDSISDPSTLIITGEECAAMISGLSA
jgi:hypothetical protein